MLKSNRAFMALMLLMLASCVGPQDGRADWKPATIGFLLVDGVYNTELVAPFDVFQHVAGRDPNPPRLFTVALHEEPLRTFEGLEINPNSVLFG